MALGWVARTSRAMTGIWGRRPFVWFVWFVDESSFVYFVFFVVPD
jgi:hypothetical protein